MSAANQGALALNSSIPAFNFDAQDIRIITDAEDILWFVAQDVMDALAYAKSSTPHKVVAHVPEEWRGRNPIPTPGGQQKLLCLSEPGLYFFLGRSDKPKALPFQKWLASEVLPSIRKTGSYGTPRIDPAGLLIGDYPELTLPLPPDMQRALDLQAWKLAGEAHALIHEHLRRRVAFSAVVGHPERYLHEGRAREVLAQGDLGDALAYCWTQKMKFLIVSAEVQAQTVAKCAAEMRAAIGQA